MAPKVLVVLTSQDKIPANGNPTGWFLVCLLCLLTFFTPQTVRR